MSQGQWKKYQGGGKGKGSKASTVNPIFDQWLMEWKADAEEKNSKIQFVYAKALNSLRKYPLLLKSGKECSILENFGPHICRMIDQRINAEGLDMSGLDASMPIVIDSDEENVEKAVKKTKSGGKKAGEKKTGEKKSGVTKRVTPSSRDGSPEPKKRRKEKGYVPAYRSGAYAILMALHLKQEPMTRTQLIEAATPYCDSAMAPSAQNHYSGWSSMKTLITKGLVDKYGSPPVYRLSEEGKEIAGKLREAERERSPSPSEPVAGPSTSQMDDVPLPGPSSEMDYVPLPGPSLSELSQMSRASSVIRGPFDSDQETEIAFSLDHDVVYRPNEYDIILMVDTSEKTAVLMQELDDLGVRTRIGRLSVGDFIWVARERLVFNGSLQYRRPDIVFPFVVERKREDDLAHSIKDGRYREQKHRLSMTKLKPIYLIEKYGKGDWGLKEGSLKQAACNTQINNKFIIYHSSSFKESCQYLADMTRFITKQFRKRVLYGYRRAAFSGAQLFESKQRANLLLYSDFKDFNFKKRIFNIKETFARQLIQIKGISSDKVYSIVSKYPTISSLIEAYNRLATEKEKKMMLANLQYGNRGRKIGPKASERISAFYTSDGSNMS